MVPDLSSPRRVHIVAVGGAAMSAIAHILRVSGHSVTGSDEVASPVLDELRSIGCTIWVGHDPAHVQGSDLVAISTAVQPSNPERRAATELGIPLATRPDMMEAIGGLRRTVAVSGTHGKTTTSAMTAHTLLAAGFDPSFIVGGKVRGHGGGVRWVPGEWLVVEADESDSSFLRFGAEAVIVTNIEPDHLDHHGTLAGLEAAFDTFVGQATGPRVVCADDVGCMSLITRARSWPDFGAIVTYGTSLDATYRIVGVEGDTHGMRFAVEHAGMSSDVRLGALGMHNARNATAAFAMAVSLGAEPSLCAAALGTFAGVGRRFEHRGEAEGVTFVDDYAHLPSEVAATMAAATAGGWRRVIAVFQPHRYTRVRDVGADFAESFDGADMVIVTELYAAGQEPIDGVTSRVVSDAIRSARPRLEVRDTSSREQLVDLLVSTLRRGDLCLTMNAGDLTTLPDELLAVLAGAS